MLSTEIKKRKHETLTLAMKMDILRQLDRGDKIVDLARAYNVGRAIIFDIRKNREKIEKICYIGRFGDRNRQTIKTGEYQKMEEAPYSWFLQERQRNTPITADILRQKALFFYQKIYKKSDFRASDEWFTKFKTRY